MRRKKNNKRKYTFLAIFLLADLLLVVTIFRSSNARFVSEAKSGTELSVALYALHLEENLNDGTSMDIKIDNLEPDGKTRYYYFTVYNTNKNGFLTNTAIEYYLRIVTTTNIPLEYELHDGLCTSPISAVAYEGISTDGSGSDAFFRTMLSSKKEFGFDDIDSDDYCLAVTFPKSYNTYQYQNLIESIQVKVESQQKME